MKKNIIKLNKTLIIGIMVLLIGSVVSPSINGYDNKTSIQTVCKASDCSPINDDFINSYWKADECSGVTLLDSSGHGYDGTIYGATWSPSGYSGCCLVFDGVDDYVDFSSHSAEIMFNKTDDLILSFYFKSTGKGLIFSATAPWGNNPEFRIELLSNGSLLFYKITQLCGIILYSNGSYNDGIWHVAEYWFNGIRSNPTVTLYVDGTFDSTITHYLCEVESVDYSKTNMGAHAHSSTNFFDGYIDEFKIIKYEQGNEQEPPVISGPKYGEPDIEYDYSFVTNDPENDDILSITIDWGDGTSEELIGPFESGEELIAPHSWTKEGKYCVKAKSVDIWDDSSWSDCYYVTIGNHPPDTPTIDGPNSGKPGIEYEFCIIASDPDDDALFVLWDWGDGTSSDWLGPIESGTEVCDFHSWNETGTYNISVTVRDEYGESVTVYKEITIPRTRSKINSLLYWFLERFQILEKLLNLK